jgi:hypothetical protein
MRHNVICLSKMALLVGISLMQSNGRLLLHAADGFRSQDRLLVRKRAGLLNYHFVVC